MQRAREIRALPTRAYVLVALVAVAGTAAAAAVVGFSSPRGVGGYGLLALCLIGLAAVNAQRMQFWWKGESEQISLDEVFFVILALNAPPAAVVLAMLFANTFGNLRFRLPAIKLLFNAGAVTLSAAAAVAVMTQVDQAPPLGTTGRGLAAACAGAMTLHGVQTLAVRAVVAAADSLPWGTVLSGLRGLDAVMLSCSISIGLLGGLVARQSVALVLLLFVPLVVLHIVLRRQAEVVRERWQLEQLLTTAVRASRASGRTGVCDLLAEATRRLLHTPVAAVREQEPGAEELGARIDAGSAPLWLVTSGSSTPHKQAMELLQGVAAIGTGALGSAMLVETIKRQALFDALTGLPNRVLLEDRFREAVRRTRTGQVAMVHLDVDRLARINTRLGREAGDQALREISDRLTSCLRPGDSAARISGDEFTVIAEVADASEALLLAEVLRSACARPLTGLSAGVVVTVSAGLALHPENGSDFEALLSAADRAMHAAKDAGRDTTRRCDAAPARFEGLELEGALRKAIGTSQIWVAYQPQLDLRTGRLVGTEALVRWTHPERGVLRPDEFLPVAEEAGLMGALDQWVLFQACRQTQLWRRVRAPWLRVAVNLSAAPLRAGDLHVRIANTLLETGLPAAALEVEVTEGVVGAEQASAIGALGNLRMMGVTVAVDDFGTGYSSLSRLRSLPVDVLKIDQSFVREIKSRARPTPLIASTLGIARGLGLAVVAEGIETSDQLECLAAAGCDSGQGYLIGRPVPSADLDQLLVRGSAWSAQLEVSAASTQALNP